MKEGMCMTMDQLQFYLMMLLTLLLVVSCSDNNEQPVDKAITITSITPQADVSDDVTLRIILNTVNMRQSPNIDSPVVAKLPANSKVIWLKQVSEVTAPVKLRGVRYNDPWLYVMNNEDKKGWIYAATAQVDTDNQTAKTLQQQLLGHRIKTFFGEGMATAIANFRAAYQQADTSEKFANMYTYGLGLRDKMVQVLRKKAVTDTSAPADMSWLDTLLPGYTHQRVAEGTGYYLFADYQQWLMKAKQTRGTEDDQFIELYLTLFPDGREGFFPAWIEQVSDYSGASRLGTGIHKSILEKLNALASTTPLFSEILNSIRMELIKDIISKKATFTEPVNKRKEELTAILQTNFNILTDADKSAIEATLQSWETGRE